MMKCRIKILAFCGSFLPILVQGMDENITPEWKYLRTLNVKKNEIQDREHDSWRIKEGKLEVNIAAEDSITLNTFSQSWAALERIDFPFLLLMIRNENYFYTPLAPVIGTDDIQNSMIVELAKKWINPITRDVISAVEVYFGGPDGNLYLLTAEANHNFFTTTLCHSRWEMINKEYKNIFTLVPELTKNFAGNKVYEFVAGLFDEYSAYNDEVAQEKWKAWKKKEKREQALEKEDEQQLSGSESNTLLYHLQSFTHSLHKLVQRLFS